jgi:DDE domain
MKADGLLLENRHGDPNLWIPSSRTSGLPTIILSGRVATGQDDCRCPRTSKDLNNLMEPDHRNTTSRTNMTLGFQRFRSAATAISGIELMHRIREGQFNLVKLDFKDTPAPAVWNTVLSAR